MKVISIIIMKIKNIDSSEKPIILSYEEDLKHISFFLRGTAREFTKFAAKEIYLRSEVMKPKSVIHENYLIHSFKITPEGLGAVMITDKEYLPRVAFSVLKKVFNEFIEEMNFVKKDLSIIKNDSKITSPFLKKMINDSQDPTKVDNIEKIKVQMDTTIETLQETVEQVLERGSKIDDLVSKTEHLSDSSKLFYQEAKKQNRCCNIV